jgi:hypothetical protein
MYPLVPNDLQQANLTLDCDLWLCYLSMTLMTLLAAAMPCQDLNRMAVILQISKALKAYQLSYPCSCTM